MLNRVCKCVHGELRIATMGIKLGVSQPEKVLLRQTNPHDGTHITTPHTPFGHPYQCLDLCSELGVFYSAGVQSSCQLLVSSLSVQACREKQERNVKEMSNRYDKIKINQSINRSINHT